IAMPWSEKTTDVMIYRGGAWEWDEDDGRYQARGSEESQYEWWCSMVRMFVRQSAGFDIDFDETDRAAWANDVSSWMYAKEVIHALRGESQ
ncbi:MAG TPA: hypothetical protein VJQ25_01080, partial [Nitrospira sp.]|nr:hypothetical protein [Nitrospira sp.]